MLLTHPEGVDYFRAKVQQGMQPPRGRKGRRAMTPLRPDLGRWAGSPAFGPNPQLFPKGERRASPALPPGRAQSACRSPSILYSGRVTQGRAPRTEDSAAGLPRWLPQRGSGTCSSDLPGKLCRPCPVCPVQFVASIGRSGKACLVPCKLVGQDPTRPCSMARPRRLGGQTSGRFP